MHTTLQWLGTSHTTQLLCSSGYLANLQGYIWWWHSHQVSKPAAGRSRPPRVRGARREPDQAEPAAGDAVLGSGGSAYSDMEEDGMLGDMGAEDCDAGAG